VFWLIANVFNLLFLAVKFWMINFVKMQMISDVLETVSASIIRETEVISSDQIQVQGLVHEGSDNDSAPAYQGEQDEQGG
jgi:hypothetical protein